MSGNAHLDVGSAIFYSTNKDGSRKLCLPPSAIVAVVISKDSRRPAEELVQFYFKIRKLQVKVSSHSFKNDGKDTYMQLYGNQGCYRSLVNSISN